MYQSRIIPFYMAYPLPISYEQEDELSRDMEYLMQMYPEQAKQYQKIIAKILDQFDYTDSMIYDEYPDKWQIYRLTKLVMDEIERTQFKDPFVLDEVGDNKASPDKNKDAEKYQTNPREMENRETQALVQVLICNEIYRRRHNKQKGILRF